MENVYSPTTSNSAGCRCGSGLTPAACCDLAQLSVPSAAQADAVAALFRRAQSSRQANLTDQALSAVRGVLEQVPCHAEALALLSSLLGESDKEDSALVLLRRAVSIKPNSSGLACDLAMLYYQRREYSDALKQARNGVRLNPKNAQAHNMMGMILTDINRLPPGEYHYRKAIELHQPIGKLCANLALNLRNQGRLDESEQWYAKAAELEPANVDTLLGWIGLKEVARDFSAGWELLSKAESIQPAHPGVRGTRANLLKREKKYDEAIQELTSAGAALPGESKSPGYFYSLGEMLDKTQRYDEAFEAYQCANEGVLATGHRDYQQTVVEKYIAELKGFFTRTRMQLMPQPERRPRGAVVPVFIVGFPRSGTTMVEQILSAHSRINAGDELPYLWELSRVAPNLLNSELTFPRCLADLWMGENQGVLDAFHDYYMRKAEQIGLTQGDVAWFTDKMPLNETHLGLIRLAFPDSPIIHLIRHPLDVVLSTYFIDLTHGYNCSYKLETAAGHYARIRGLVDHYRQQLDLNYLAVRYEDIVADPETHSRRMLEFVGAEWQPACLDFHLNARYARTASYAQVTEKLYTSSRYRYRNYRRHLEPVLPLLGPVIEQLGYTLD